MFPAGGFQLRCALGAAELDAWLSGAEGVEGSYTGNGYSSDAGGNAGFWGGGEEKLVVFAAVQGGLESLFGGECASQWMERKGLGVYLRADIGGFAEMG